MKILLGCFCFFIALSVKVQAFQLKIASYNIRNFDYDSRAQTSTDKNALYRVLKNTGADIIGVQEIVNANEFKAFIRGNFPHYSVALTSCGGSGDQKLGFIYRRSSLRLKEFYEDERLNIGRRNGCNQGSRPASIGIFQNLKSKTRELILFVGVHLKAGGMPENAEKRAKQYSIIKKILAEYRNGHGLLDATITNSVVLGDFNTTEYGTNTQYHRNFINFVRQSEMKDTTANVGCSSYWHGNDPDDIHQPSQLDHILVSRTMLNKADNYKSFNKEHCAVKRCRPTHKDDLPYTYHNVSDHCPIITQLVH